MQIARVFNFSRYEAIAFLSGASVLILEIVGSRLIAPYFGTSTYVWTAMIGVILGSLALGYVLGGKMADSNKADDLLPHIILVAASLILLSGMTHDSVLANVADRELDLRLSSFLSALILFAPPSLLLGMISPYLAKKRITSLSSTGWSFGRLEAAGALGSIAGTFGCGYFLLDWFGSQSIVIGVVLVLVATSVLANPRLLWRVRLLILVASLLVGAGIPYRQDVLADIDSAYARYRVVEGQYDNQPVRMLITDNRGIQSAVTTIEPHEPVFSYIDKFYSVLNNFPDPEEIMVVGGGTYTFPSLAARRMPEVSIDAVEIDPALKKIAQEYFYFEELPNLRIIHEDGRTFVNQNDRHYDIVFLDAFNSIDPPFHLTTKEMLINTKDNLGQNGMVVANVVGRISDGQSGYLEAAIATYKEIFASVDVFLVGSEAVIKDTWQNYVIVANGNNSEVNEEILAGLGKPINFKNGGLILTDDFAPVERLMN